MFQIWCKEPGIQSGYSPALRLPPIQWERQIHAQVNTQNGVHAITDIYCHNPEERAQKQGWYSLALGRGIACEGIKPQGKLRIGDRVWPFCGIQEEERAFQAEGIMCMKTQSSALLDQHLPFLSLCVCVSLYMLTREWWRRWQETLRSPLWFKNKIREREAVDGAGGVRGFGLRGWENIMTLHIMSIYYVMGVSRHCLPKYGSFYSSLILQRRKQVGWG